MVSKLALAMGMSCPGSAAWFHHSQCQVTIRFVENCTIVYDEVVARIEGRNGWVDPHNGGAYTQTGGVRGVHLCCWRCPRGLS